MKMEIPWRHYFLCMAIYGALVTTLEATVPMTPLLRGLLLIGTIAAYIAISKQRTRQT